MPDDPNDLRKLFSDDNDWDKKEDPSDSAREDDVVQNSPEADETEQPISQQDDIKEEIWGFKKKFGIEDTQDKPEDKDAPEWAEGLQQVDETPISAVEPETPASRPETPPASTVDESRRHQKPRELDPADVLPEVSELRDLLFSGQPDEPPKKKKQRKRYVEPKVEANPLPSFIGLIGGICIAVALLMGVLGFTSGIGMLGLTGIGVLMLLIFMISNRRNLRLMLSARSTRYGTNVMIVIASLLAILVLLNGISADHYYAIDVTSDKLNTLSDQTLQVLSELDSKQADVKATVFIKRESEYRGVLQNVEEMLNRYRYHFSGLKVEYLDPDVDKEKADNLEFSDTLGIVFEMGDKSEKAVEFDIDSKKWLYESSMTSALLRLSGSHTKRIYFLTGHGELVWDNYSSSSDAGAGLLAQELTQVGYQVEKLSFSAGANVPDDGSLLIIPEPKRKLMPEEIDGVRNYILGGGKVILLLDANEDAGFTGMLKEFGIIYRSNLIADKVYNLMGGNFHYPVLDLSDHPINIPLNKANNVVVFYRASSMDQGETDPGTNVVSLLRTRAGGSSIDTGTVDPEDKNSGGPFTMAVMSEIRVYPGTQEGAGDENPADTEEGKKWGLILAAGDASFIANKNLNTYGNKDFILNAVDFMTSGEAFMTNRPANTSPKLQLTKGQVGTAFVITSALLPLLIGAMGFVVWLKRR